MVSTANKMMVELHCTELILQVNMKILTLFSWLWTMKHLLKENMDYVLLRLRSFTNLLEA